MPILKIREESGEREVRITDSATIGRAPGNTVVIDDPSSSKEHCRIEPDGERWKLVDLESKNGTRVNGVFKNRAYLEHADMIRIGQAEFRFELEDAPETLQRTGAKTPASTPASASRGAPAQPAKPTGAAPLRASARAERDAELDDDEEAPPPRRRTSGEGDLFLKVGLIFVGVMIIFIVANNMASGLQRAISGNDEHKDIRARAREMRRNDQWEEAAAYLEENLDSDKTGYERTRRLLEETYDEAPAHYRSRGRWMSSRLYYELQRDIRNYHAGSDTVTPDEIRKKVKRMQQEFADTELSERARQKYPAWFAGRVPARGSSSGTRVGGVEKDWDTAGLQSKAFERRWMFREAREVIQRFLVTHEAILGDEKLQIYRGREQEELHRLELAASSIYTGQRQIARTAVKKKRYSQAIKIWKKIIDSFGIDSYVRKAKSELQQVELQRSQNK